jgi:4-amino-4-deoxy-L-arabinose transferase-like glycosyltransferase
MPESAQNPRPRYREFILVLWVWFLLAAATAFLARQNLSVPGLYYDEAVFGGLAKDFLTGTTHGEHMPDHQVMTLAGKPFPFFVQTYLGALKSWILIPALAVFGPSTAVVRGSNLFWEVIALLLLMLTIRRCFGGIAAVIAGFLLAFDPTFLFISVLDWGVAVPSFLCRCAGLYFLVRWKKQRKLRDAFLLGLFAGLGFFNKADFAIFLMATVLAVIVCYRRDLLRFTKEKSSGVALACLGFVIGGGPMLLKIPRMIALTVSGPHPSASGETSTKFKTLLSMYDGSHFYRLMNAGGVFERMYDGASGPKSLFGLAVVIACILSGALIYQKKIVRPRALAFLVLAAALITLGVFLLPDAVRIHHAFLVYPFPHLIIAALIGLTWNSKSRSRIVVLLGVVIISVSSFVAVHATQALIQQTGGRGRWSESLNQFCFENRNRSDLIIVSLDWGFNEQLMFLTDGPQLSEPFWEFNQSLPPLPSDPNYIYLAHPARYSVLKYDIAYLNQLQNDPQTEITPHLDRENEVAFYTIRFRQH